MATTDPEKMRAKWRRRYARNPEKHKRRARNRSYVRRAQYAVSDITPQQESAMRRKARKCRMCGCWMTSKPGQPNSKHLDHILPINAGGTHTHGNVRIICRTCNLSRPKDGSDYTGQLTLWAQAPGIAVAVRIRQPKPNPVTRKPVTKTCKCGSPFKAPGRTLMCDDCMLAAVRTAIALNLADGLSWGEIAPKVGYATAEGIRYAAKRAGFTSGPKAAAKRTLAACACGSPAYRKGKCQACIASTARRAVMLREQGWTLRMIADELGYSSITTVTNMMKTVVEIETRIGRPNRSA